MLLIFIPGYSEAAIISAGGDITIEKEEIINDDYLFGGLQSPLLQNCWV